MSVSDGAYRQTLYDLHLVMEERRVLTEVLYQNGFVPCDIPACNCGSWHHVGGFKRRFDEIDEVLEPRNGETVLNAAKRYKDGIEKIMESASRNGEDCSYLIARGVQSTEHGQDDIVDPADRERE